MFTGPLSITCTKQPYPPKSQRSYLQQPSPPNLSTGNPSFVAKLTHKQERKGPSGGWSLWKSRLPGSKTKQMGSNDVVKEEYTAKSHDGIQLPTRGHKKSQLSIYFLV